MRRTSYFHCLTTLIVLSGWLTLRIGTSRAENWPRFRGENGLGICDEKGFSSPWNPDRVRWTVPVPGVGHSSPVIWGNKLFLTAASETGTTRSVLCFDAQS